MSEKFISINRVIQYLRYGILNNTWKVGEKIPSEHEICRALDVSRNSVRCALAPYVALGVLNSVHGKGTYVHSNNLPSVGSGRVSGKLYQAMYDFLNFRRMLEPDLCYHAAINISDSCLDSLYEILVEMKEHAEIPDVFVQCDCRFHLTIAEASACPIAVDILQNLFLSNYVFLSDMNHALGSCNAYYYHASILDALKKHDDSRARQLMKDHLEKSMSELCINSPKIP